MKLTRQVTRIGRIAAVFAAGFLLPSAFAAQNPVDSGQAVPARVASSKVTPSPVITVIYNFGSNSGDPQMPIRADVIAQGHDGKLYSSSDSGGAFIAGTDFNITLTGTVSVLHSFDRTDGSDIYSGRPWAAMGIFMA